MTCKEIFEDISTYQFDENSILDFVLCEHEDINTFSYFRNMLFNLLELDNSLDRLISFFYKLEYGSTIFGNITIVEGGEKLEVRPITLLNKEIEEEKDIYKKFSVGDTETLKDILDYYEKLLIDLKKLKSEFKFDDVQSLCEDVDGVDFDIHANERRIKEYKEKLEEQKKNLDENNPIIVEIEKVNPENTSRTITIYTYNHFKKYHLKKYEKDILAKIRSLEEENKLTLTNKNSLLDQLRNICQKNDANIVWDTLSSHYEYYNRDIRIHNVLKNILDMRRYYDLFLDELYSASETVKSFSSLLDEFNGDLDLLRICSSIRKSFSENCLPTNSRYENVWQNNIRTTEVKSFTQTAKTDELDSVMDDLNNRFKSIMDMEPSLEFVKAVADFHFDFLKVHPYLDGNGRTSRTLLTLMLASKDILVPSLYSSSEEKSDFYLNSNVALKGDYSVIENELLSRLIHFNPIILKEEKEEMQPENIQEDKPMKL